MHQRQRTPFIWGTLLLGFLLVMVFVTVGSFSSRGVSDSNAIPSPLLNTDLEDFFRNYWQTPIPLQGSPPPTFTEKEASISPEACGSCHTQQYADWKKSLHSMAMGPGPWGQIVDLTQNSADGAVLCMTCHAPLSEQMPFLAKKTNSGKVKYVANAYYDPQLQVRGIVCAACHVRQHQRFGPPKAEGAMATHYPAGMPKHGGVQRTPFFEKAEFCKGCHQFDPENTGLINGKPIQDTYREWKQSIWGQGGATCQDCHMPDRRHLWKGIHDAEWVRNGVRMETQVKRYGLDPGSPLELQVEVLNSAVGHKFPTYLTPKVFVRALLLNGMGRVISGTKKEEIIGWDARFEGGRWKEYFDTRIPPGAKSKHIFHWTPSTQAKKIRAWVEVYPDHFYHFYFYPVYLGGGGLSRKGRKLEEKALEESGLSSYILFERIIPLN